MEALEITRLLLLVAHIVGASAIVGSFILMMPKRTGFDFAPMLVGAIVQLVTGVALVAVREMAGLDVSSAKMIVKLGITALVLGLVVALLAWQRRTRATGRSETPLRPLLYVAGFAGIANIAVAVLWR